MRTDSRLFRMLHVLLHMARDKRSYTSEELAKMLGTNAAVVRRTMGSLRERKYVLSEKGHGGGWSLSCDLKKVTLLDIYSAVGKPTIFGIGASESKSKCLIEKVVNKSIDDALDKAEQLVLESFGSVRLHDLNAELDLYLEKSRSCK